MKDLRTLKSGKAGSKFIGQLPKGCQLCYDGAKSVIFITGICYEKCYYCPISYSRRNKDVIFINDLKVESFEDILREIYDSKALGVSITGGEPLVFPGRVLLFIRRLKEIFGEEFHIHLYTIGKQLTKELIMNLYEAGLDEIRFHIVEYGLLKKVEYTVKHTNMDVGVEVPVVPGNMNFYKKLIIEAEKYGAKFVNLNELEISEGNYRSLLERGFKLKKGTIASVEGSEEDALKILKWAAEHTSNINVHYCSALYKDLVQTRVRLRRKALNTAKPYEEISHEGTVLRGEIWTSVRFKDKVFKFLKKTAFDYKVNNNKLVVFVPVGFLRNIVSCLRNERVPFKALIVEEYPGRTRIVKNVMPYHT